MPDSVQPHEQQPTRLLCPQGSPGKNTGVGCQNSKPIAPQMEHEPTVCGLGGNSEGHFAFRNMQPLQLGSAPGVEPLTVLESTWTPRHGLGLSATKAAAPCSWPGHYCWGPDSPLGAFVPITSGPKYGHQGPSPGRALTLRLALLCSLEALASCSLHHPHGPKLGGEHLGPGDLPRPAWGHFPACSPLPTPGSHWTPHGPSPPTCRFTSGLR